MVASKKKYYYNRCVKHCMRPWKQKPIAVGSENAQINLPTGAESIDPPEVVCIYCRYRRSFVKDADAAATAASMKLETMLWNDDESIVICRAQANKP